MKFWLVLTALFMNSFLVMAKEVSVQDFSHIQMNKSTDRLEFGDSPLYQELENYFLAHHERIAENQLNNITWGDDHRIWGGVNHIGLDYSKNFLDFSVSLRRQVAPDLFHDERYIVTDIMDIYINASKLFERLRDEGEIDITKEQLKAIAGLTFKRSYRFNHFADNYRDALTLNLNRLFFSFTYFRSKNFLKLLPGEFITKEDYLGVYAGFAGSLPLSHGLNAHMGALAKYERVGKVEIYAPLENERSNEEDDLRINYERSEVASLGITAGLVSDFLGVLRLTLLQFDFEYSLEKSYKTFLNFSFKEIDEYIKPDSEVSQAIGNILKHRLPKLEVVAPFIVSEERRRIERRKIKYAALYWGIHRDQETSQVQIVKEGFVQNFFKHNATFKKQKGNLVDWFVNAFFQSFAKIQSFIKKDSEHIKTIKIEYESKENLIASKNELLLNSDKKTLSINFIREFRERIKKRDSHKSSKKAIDMLEKFAGVDPYVIRKYEGSGFKNRLSSHIYTTFDEDGIRYFHGLNYSQLKSMINRTCNSKSIFNLCRYRLRRLARKYINEKLTRRVQRSDVSLCNDEVAPILFRSKRQRAHRKCLVSRVLKSQEKWVNEVPLWRLKSFFEAILLRSKSKISYYDYVGMKNVHTHGNFKSYRGDTGLPVQHYFKEGFFQGLGVISSQND